MAQAAAADEPPRRAQRVFDDVAAASRVLAESRETLRVRPQLRIDAGEFAELAANDDLLLPDELAARRPGSIVTTPRPYLRWEPVPAPALVAQAGARHGGAARRPGRPQRHPGDAGRDRRRAAHRPAQGDAARGRGRREVRRGHRHRRRGRDPAAVRDRAGGARHAAGPVRAQPHRPARDRTSSRASPSSTGRVPTPARRTGRRWRRSRADRGRPIGEGQYVVHDTDALRLPYLPDPYATGVSLVFYEAGAPHVLPEPRALQAVTVPYPGAWPSLQPLRLVVEPGDALGARVVGHEVHVPAAAGRAGAGRAVEHRRRRRSLDKFGLWRSHLASVVDPADGYTTDEVVAAAALMRAASSGWTWWLTPSTDVRLRARRARARAAPRAVGAEPVPAAARPVGRRVHRAGRRARVEHRHASSCARRGPRRSTTSPRLGAAGGVEVRRRRALARRRSARRPACCSCTTSCRPARSAQALGGIGFHRMLQTFEDTHYRRVTYVPSGTTRYAEYFAPARASPSEPATGEPVVLDIPSSARPAAPLVLDSVPLLRWEEVAEPDEPFAWRQVRRSGVRIWLARPWFSSGDGELLGVLVFDTDEWVPGRRRHVSRANPRRRRHPTARRACGPPTRSSSTAGRRRTPTVPPLLTFDQLVLDAVETGAAESVGIRPPLARRGPRRARPRLARRAWQPGRRRRCGAAARRARASGGPGAGLPAGVRRGRRGRWFVDVALQETPALWPFVRLAVARFQPQSIEGCSLSPVALTSWVQPLPTRTLTVSRPDPRHVQVTLTGVVNWLRWDPRSAPGLAGEQLSADSPTGDAAVRAARLQQSRTVRATVQSRAAGAGDLEWETVSTSLLLAVSVEESGGFRATWTGAVMLPPNAGTPSGDAAGYPGLRRPGGPELVVAGARRGARAARRRSDGGGGNDCGAAAGLRGQRDVVGTRQGRRYSEGDRIPLTQSWTEFGDHRREGKWRVGSRRRLAVSPFWSSPPAWSPA